MGASDSRLSGMAALSTAERLKAVFAGRTLLEDPARCLQQLVGLGLGQLPLPGSGQTLQRWRALATVAAHDLSLAKLYEGHTDALAIIDELEPDTPLRKAAFEAPTAPSVDNREVWGVWASETPGNRVIIQADAQHADGRVGINGRKQWCSGAGTGSHALLTAWHADGREPQLVRIQLNQPGVEVSAGDWHAVGMGASSSFGVRFEKAIAYPVGAAGSYLSRPGFWQGGAGVAACWYGGATTIAKALHRSVANSEIKPNPFRLAAAGRVDVMMKSAALMLQDAARWIDDHPNEDASLVALRARLCVARCALQVLEETGNALGATPYCRDAEFARAAADLPVFIRQSHGDRDYAALGEKLGTQGDLPWAL